MTLAEHFLNGRFARVYSGLYYQIRSAQGQTQISRSLFDKEINPVDQTARGALTWGSAVGPENQRLRVVSRKVDLTPDNNTPDSYTFLVAGDMAEVDRQTAEFNTTLFWSFLLLGVGLIGAILVQVKIGLSAAAAGERGADPHPRRQGAAAGRAFSHRDRAARRRTQFPDPAQRGSGGPRAHPCLQPGAFPQDASVGAGRRSRCA